MTHQKHATGHNQATAVASAVSPLRMPLHTPPGEPTEAFPVVTPMVYVREVTPWE